MAYKKVVRKYKKTTYKRKSYARKAKRAPLKRAIKAVLARSVETKSQQMFNYNRSIYSSNSINFPDNVIELGPSGALQVVQGVTRCQRIGNKVRVKRLMFKGDICANPYDATLNPNPSPQLVKMVIFYDRTDPTALPTVSTNFFQNGASNVGFNNDLVDAWRPFNTERYRILATRTFKVGNAISPNLGVNTSFQSYANNDYKMTNTFSVDLTKYYPKTCVFDENNVTPNSRGLFAIFYCCAGSGQANGAAWIPCSMQYMQEFSFTDA